MAFEANDDEAARALRDMFDPEADEGNALINVRQKSTIVHHPSVFSLLVFAPPLSRLNAGHYWTLPVFISFALTIILVTCQFGLSLIAGQHIRAQTTEFKMHLIKTSRKEALPQEITPMGWVGSNVYDQVTGFDWLGKNHAFMPWNWRADTTKEKCCNGADCAALHLQCCDRSNLVIDTSAGSNNVSSLMAMSKSALGETERHIGHSWEEMCLRSDDGTLSCAPPSFLYLDAWDELDTNHDGVWSAKEAAEDRANLGCRFGSSVIEMFGSICRGIEKDAQDTSAHSYSMPIVPHEIETRKGIKKEYFDWWKALSVICVAPDMNRCSELIKSGVFDGAIRMAKEDKVSRGGIVDLDTSLDFCQRLLSRNGICEKTLPSSYLMYRSRLAATCGRPTYEVSGAGKYHNPFDSRDAMSIVHVEYETYQSYLESSEFHFQCFLFLILMVWYISLVAELKQIQLLFDFARNFRVNLSSPWLTEPMQAWIREHMTGKLECIAVHILPVGDESHRSKDVFHREAGTAGRELQAKMSRNSMAKTFGAAWTAEDQVMVIDSHSRSQRYLVFGLVGVRMFLWLYLADVGTSFFIYTRDYANILTNAVALAFIFAFPEFLYQVLVPEIVKDKLRGSRTVPFPSGIPNRGWQRTLMLPMTWGLFVIPLCVATVIWYNLSFNTMPFLEALECACYQKGPTCSVSARFQKAWWDQYWQDTSALALRRTSWLHA